MALAILVVGAAALLVVAALAWPLLVEDSGPAPEDPSAEERRELDEALERSLAAIREIDEDHRAGNLSEQDFAALDRGERARAAELLRRRDALAGGGQAAPEAQIDAEMKGKARPGHGTRDARQG